MNIFTKVLFASIMAIGYPVILMMATNQPQSLWLAFFVYMLALIKLDVTECLREN